MSNMLNAIINNQFFYILPICNLPCDSVSSGIDNTFIDSNIRGARSSTNVNQAFDQYNDNFGITQTGIIIIPDYIKELNPDYISFSVTTDGGTITNTNHTVTSVSLNIIYNLVNGINPFITGDQIQYTLSDETKYYVNCKYKNGALYPIDLSCIHSFSDIAFTYTEIIPAPVASPDKNNKARPYNITLWKKFIKSDINNKTTFIKQNNLPSTHNTYIG